MVLCYRDRTFCKSDCTDRECGRFVSPEIEAEAKRLNMPLALANYSDRCPDYRPPRAIPCGLCGNSDDCHIRGGCDWEGARPNTVTL